LQKVFCELKKFILTFHLCGFIVGDGKEAISMQQGLAQTLKARRKELGLSVKYVLERLNEYGINISDKTLYGWESGHRQPDSDTFLVLCRIYNIDSLSLFTPDKKSAPFYSNEAVQLAQDYEKLDTWGKRQVRSTADVEMARCAALAQSKPATPEAQVEKLVYLNPAAAGAPLYAESDFERLTFPAASVPLGADFGIRISGHSMEPTIRDGAIVWVHKVTDLGNGEVGVFMLNDSAVCKRFFRGEDGAIRLESDNQEFSSVLVSEFDTVILVGRVVGAV